MIAVTLLLTIGSALLLGMERTMVHTDYLAQMQVAVNSAQGELEELMSVPFLTLLSDPAYANARVQLPTASGLRVCIGEDSDCDGVLDPGEDQDGDNQLDPSPLPGGMLSIQIRNADVRDPVDPGLLSLHVAACWQYRGIRIGEDRNCNGQLEATEDTNGNGWMDSPVMVDTVLGRRDEG